MKPTKFTRIIQTLGHALTTPTTLRFEVAGSEAAVQALEAKAQKAPCHACRACRHLPMSSLPLSL